MISIVNKHIVYSGNENETKKIYKYKRRLIL